MGGYVPNTFKNLLAKQRFLTRFLASGLGVLAVFCWDCVYASEVYTPNFEARGLQSADRSVPSRRPAYAVAGPYWGIRERDPLFFLRSQGPSLPGSPGQCTLQPDADALANDV